MKIRFLNPAYIAAFVISSFLTACDSPPQAEPVAKQSPKPRVDLAKTKNLYNKISLRQTDSSVGEIEWREGGGILLQPGKKPTEVVFDVSDMKGRVNFAFWISKLPDNVLISPKAGTASFEVFLDGKSQGRQLVNRMINQSLEIDLTGVSKFRIVVDDSDGSQLCDWFFMGVQ